MRTLLCALLLAAVAAAQSFDEMLPDTTVFYVSIENAARTKERWGTCRLAALWKDEAMQGFLDKPRAQWATWMEGIRKEDAFTPDDVLDLLSGQAVVAGVWPEGAEEPAPLFLADIGENGGKLRDLMARVEKRLVEEKGGRRDEEEFRGVKIVSHAEKEGDKSAWFLDGNTFAMAESAEALKDMLARRDRKGEGTLASRENYRRARARLGARGGEFLLYVDGPNLIQALVDAGETDGEMRILGALGITAIESFALEFAIEEKGLAMRTFLAVRGAKTGFLKIFDGKNSALMPPRYAPADSLTAGAIALDVPGLWEETRKVMDRVEQGGSERMDAWFTMLKEQVGVDIPADIIASLGTEIAYHTLAPAADARAGPGAPPGMDGRFVLSIQLKERERFEAAVEKLLTAFGFATATQDYLGVKVRKVPTPFGVQPVFATLPDRLLFSLSADDVKDVIARYGKEAKGMLDREDVARALAGLPAQRSAVSVEDMPKSFATASSTIAAALALVAESGEVPELAEFIDFSLFPPAEVLAKYIGMNAGCLVNEEDGVSYVSVISFVRGE